MNSVEHFFTCPYCWQNISMVLELTEDAQVYIEDCEVCCQPIQIRFSGSEDRAQLEEFSCEPAQGN